MFVAPSTLVLATTNLGKLQEFKDLLQDAQISILSQLDLAVPEIPETGSTFVENAILKARNAAMHSGLPALADDSGLEVDFLGGAPGVYSARYAGHKSDFIANCRKVLSEMIAASEEERTARFQCVLAFMRHAQDPSPIICQGTWEGRILFEPCGDNGFGYDPIFYVPTHDCSAAELAPAVKNTISHRGQALAQWLKLMQPALQPHDS